MSHGPIVEQNCDETEAKLIENLLPLGLEDDELHFNRRPEYAKLLIILVKSCEPSCKLFVTMTLRDQLHFSFVMHCFN